MWPLNIARMLLLRGLKMDPLPNKLLWIILLKVVGSTTYSIPTTSKYEDKSFTLAPRLPLADDADTYSYSYEYGR